MLVGTLETSEYTLEKGGFRRLYNLTIEFRVKRQMWIVSRRNLGLLSIHMNLRGRPEQALEKKDLALENGGIARIQGQSINDVNFHERAGCGCDARTSGSNFCVVRITSITSRKPCRP